MAWSKYNQGVAGEHDEQYQLPVGT
jgi:hypothetical protein